MSLFCPVSSPSFSAFLTWEDKLERSLKRWRKLPPEDQVYYPAEIVVALQLIDELKAHGEYEDALARCKARAFQLYPPVGVYSDPEMLTAEGKIAAWLEFGEGTKEYEHGIERLDALNRIGPATTLAKKKQQQAQIDLIRDPPGKRGQPANELGWEKMPDEMDAMRCYVIRDGMARFPAADKVAAEFPTGAQPKYRSRHISDKFTEKMGLRGEKYARALFNV